MRASKFDGAKKTTDAPFELPEASAVRRTNAHKMTTLAKIPLREFLAIATLSSCLLYKCPPSVSTHLLARVSPRLCPCEKFLAVAAGGMCVAPGAAAAKMVDAGVAMPAAQSLWLFGEYRPLHLPCLQH